MKRPSTRPDRRTRLKLRRADYAHKQALKYHERMLARAPRAETIADVIALNESVARPFASHFPKERSANLA